jgi:hypothetical protein
MVRSLTLGWYRLDHQRRLDLLLFLAVPAVLAATMAVVGPYADALGLRGGVLYVAALSFVPWWLAGLATHLAFVGLRPLRPPLWSLTLIGAIAASILLLPATHELNGWFRASWPGGHLLHELSWPLATDRIREVLVSTGRAAVLWTAFTYVFATTLGWSRYQYARQTPTAAASTQEPPSPSRFENSGRHWTEENDLELTALVAAGLGPAEIARRMQRTVAAIRVRIAKINAGVRKS